MSLTVFKSLTSSIVKDDEPSDYGHVLLPVVVSHIIDEDSPLYNLGPADLVKAK